MQALNRPAVGFGRVAAGVGRVAGDDIAHGDQAPLNQFGQGARAGRSKTVAQDHIHLATPVRSLAGGCAGHGVPVHQHCDATSGPGVVDQLSQCAMIGAVDGFDPPARLGERELAIVNLPPLRHQARDRAESGGHPGGPRACELRQVVHEHARVQLVGLTVHVDIGAGVAGQKNRAAVMRRTLQKVIHQGVFRAAHCGRIQLGRSAHVRGVVAA